MDEKTLSIFVDESGNFGCPDRASRYYVIGLVLHDQSSPIRDAIGDLDLALRDMHISHHYFHAGPMIRREKGYKFMDWGFRRRIFAAMMAFARKVDFRYFCLTVDKKFVASREQIVEQLEGQLREYLTRHADKLLELKLQNGETLTESEQRFFGGPRDFKRNVLKKLKHKELS